MRSSLFPLTLLLLAVCGFAQQGSIPGPDAGPLGIGTGILGRVTAIAPDHFTVKTQAGQSWTIRFSPNTRMMKQPPALAAGANTPASQPSAFPQSIKPADVKPGDNVLAAGAVDDTGRSMGAIGIVVLDADTARRMRQMEAGFGKTWLAGRITAVNGSTITLRGGPANEIHTFAVDDHTTFRKGSELITAADLHPGDPVRVEGSLKDGQFVARTVTLVMPPARGGPIKPHGAPPR